MLSRKSSRSSLMGKSVTINETGTRLRTLSDEEELEKDIKIHPELQSTLQKLDQFLKLLQTVKGDNSKFLVSLKADVGAQFEKYTTEMTRSIMSRYLGLKGFAEGMFRKYENLTAVIGVQVLTADYLAKNQKLLEVQILMEIRKILWTCSDSSLLVADRIVATPIFKYLLEDVKAIKKSLPKVSDDNIVFDTAVGIMYNCAKNHETRPRFRELKVADTLLPFLKATSTKVKLTAVLLLAHIVDDSNNRLLKSDGSVFDFLINMIRTALDDVHHKCYQSNVYFSVAELVSGLEALAKNDENKQMLVDKGALKPLEVLLKSGSEVEQQVALYCIRELAFNTDNKAVMNADSEMMDVLKEKAESNNSQIAKAAKLTRWGLASEILVETRQRQSIKRRESSITKSVKMGHVMLSYSWSNQKQVLKIYEHLKREGFLLWVDVDDMAGSTLDAMASAVENASAIIMFVSEMYFESQNCRQEAEYSFKNKKTIFPVMLQANFRPSGWLGIIMATTLYFDFSSEPKLKELIKALGDCGKNIPEVQVPAVQDKVMGSTSPSVSTEPVLGGKSTKVSKWTNTDVMIWLTRINMTQCSGLKTLTGEELVFLQQLSYRAPEFYYGYLERNLKLKTLKELMTFANELTALTS